MALPSIAWKTRRKPPSPAGGKGGAAFKPPLSRRKTKPSRPPHYEATLQQPGETAEIEDDALRQALKDCGISTPPPAPPSSKRSFVTADHWNGAVARAANRKGLALHSVVKAVRIADVAMTGRMGEESGTYRAQQAL